jgi:hypothetical protein
MLYLSSLETFRLKYIKEIDLAISDRIHKSFNEARPSWAKAGTFIECEAWYFDTDNEEDDLQDVLLLADVKPEQKYIGSFSYPNSEQLSQQFWVVYKPDFSVFTWLDDKPGELSQSAMVLVNPLEKTYPDAENIGGITSYLRFEVVKVLPFRSMANYLEPIYSENPLIHFHEIVCGNINTYWEYFSKVIDRDLILIEAWIQGDVGAWFVCYYPSEYDAPTLLFYTYRPILESYQFFGNCPLSQEQWKNLELYCKPRHPRQT